MSIIIIDFKFKHILSNEIIVYKNNKTFNIFNIIIIEFENVFIDIKNIINLLKN